MRNLKRFVTFLLAAVLAFSLSAIALAAGDTGFSDVDSDAWYAEAVRYCREHNLMNGTSSTTFEPDSPLTCAMLVTVLYRMEGSPAVTGTDTFTDTADGQWYSNAVLWASRNEIVGGYGNGLFGTDDHVTREDMVTILWRYAGEPATETASLSDAASVSRYAVSAVNWAVSNGIAASLSGTIFAPSTEATRAQVAAALMNYDRSAQTTPTSAPEPSGGGKVLVAYFSGTGTTAVLAEYIADGLGAALYEIIPETPYTSTDLNYSDSSTRATAEMNDPTARPAISGSVDSMEQYGIVFIGYPIWWGQAPRIISTFLESYDFSGKTIVPFCTSGSSGMGSSAWNLHSLTDGATWLDGQRFSGGTSRSAMVTWVNSLDLDMTAE